MAIPAPKLLDFGSGSSSEVSFNHKAFTFYKGLMALPVSGSAFSDRLRYYRSAIELVRVDAATGFQHLGTIDHAPLYANNGAGVGCGSCDALGCYDYYCGYSAEVRRGHFVEGDGTTYVYSFSHAGVLVNDLQDLSQSIARVGLPAPAFDSYTPWYDSDGKPVVVVDAGSPRTDAGVASRDGGGSVTWIAADGGVQIDPVLPQGRDAGSSVALPSSDAGAPTMVILP